MLCYVFSWSRSIKYTYKWTVSANNNNNDNGDLMWRNPVPYEIFHFKFECVWILYWFDAFWQIIPHFCSMPRKTLACDMINPWYFYILASSVAINSFIICYPFCLNSVWVGWKVTSWMGPIRFQTLHFWPLEHDLLKAAKKFNSLERHL